MAELLPRATLLLRATEARKNAGPDAILTHHTALARHGCRAAERVAVHVLAPGRRRVRSEPGMVVHHGAVAERDVETVHTLPALALEPALADVLCRGRPPVALRCLEQAVARHPPDHRERLRARVAACVQARADPRGRRRAMGLAAVGQGPMP